MAIRKPAFAIALAVIVALSLWNLSKAYGSEVEIIDMPHTWVFVEKCDTEYPMLPDIPNATVVCFPSAKLWTLYQLVPVLREIFPADLFVFVYDLRDPDVMADWELFLWLINGNRSPGVYGQAFINEGYSIAAYAPDVIEHEWLHIYERKYFTSDGRHDHEKSIYPMLWVMEKD